MWRRYFQKLKSSKATRNAAASYFAFFSTTITGLVSIPLAVHFLPKEDLGLWAVVMAFCSYLSYMEMGIGLSTGRKMADAIVARNKEEIDQWWTLTRVVLFIQGLFVIAVGLSAMPFFLDQMAADYPDRGKASFYCVVTILFVGINFPFQGAEGILTAQERFHWVPLRQALIFWVELVTFASFLFLGWGLYSFLWSKAAVMLVVWICNAILLGQSEPRLGWNSSGLRWDRFRSLFAFSLNLSTVGLADTLLKTLPVMILAKMGGLATVPIYSFTIKVSVVLASLGKRTYQSFYPAFQTLFIQANYTAFKTKFQHVCHLTLALSLGIAGFVLCFNRAIVDVLAKPDFYAGSMPTAWFAAAVIVATVGGSFEILLPISGTMGKSALVSISKLLVGLGLYLVAHRFFGLVGLAAIAAALPLAQGAYGYFRGARGCGFESRDLAGNLIVLTAGSVLLVLGGGYLISILPSAPYLIPMFGKQISLPTWPEITIGGGIGSMAAVALYRSLRRFKTAPVSTSPAQA